MSERGQVPVRTCVGCTQRSPQPELIRIVAQPNGALRVDRSRHFGGRGAYLHRTAPCWQQFASRKGSVRSLRRTIDKGARQALMAALQQELGA